VINYDSFGYSTTQVPTGYTRYRYAGREYDPDTQLYYYRARWYDPKARRFISEDPIGLAGGINLYAYVSNNPIGFTDPSGLQSKFPAAEKGLADISKMKCNDKCTKWLEGLAKLAGMDVNTLIKNIHESANNIKLYDGETSNANVYDPETGITKPAEKWFSNSRFEAISDPYSAAIYLRPSDWSGGWIYGSRMNDRKGNVTNYGKATLLHEMLHKTMVSGRMITHENMFPKASLLQRMSDPLNYDSDMIQSLCFP
jgi:RHS repeat-associated protein